VAKQSNETPVLDLLGRMTADSVEVSSLDSETLLLVRIAVLAAVDAPPVSYLMNLGAARRSASRRSRCAACWPRSRRSWAPRVSPRRRARSSARARARDRSGRARERDGGGRLTLIGLRGRYRVRLPGALSLSAAPWNAGHNGRPMRASEEIMDFRSTPQPLSHPVAGASPGVRGHLCRRSARRPSVHEGVG
jgi:hypothetical protein